MAGQSSNAAELAVAVSGASGLIGAALCPVLRDAGYRVVRLSSRGAGGPDELAWDASAGIHDVERLDGAGAFVHLAGENIAGGRWTTKRKARIRSSRVDGTRAIVRSLARLKRPPAHFLCASAIGFYGDRGDTLLDESGAAGSSFLAELAAAWEREALAARDFGARVALLRFGAVLSAHGGALAKLRPIFALGMGGPIGTGRQYLSWISLDDAIGAIVHVLNTASIAGPVNIVAPAAVRNAEFAQTLGRVLRRPAIVPVPALAVRAVLGPMADETVLASVRVRPTVLESTGFTYRHPALGIALDALLLRRRERPAERR